MNKKTKFILLFLFTFFLSISISCRKHEIEQNTNLLSTKGLTQKNVTGAAQKDLLIEWLNSHDRGLKPLQKEIFENIKDHLQFDLLTIEKRNNGENLIIIPINTEVRTLLSAKANYLQLNDKTLFNLMIVQN